MYKRFCLHQVELAIHAYTLKKKKNLSRAEIQTKKFFSVVNQIASFMNYLLKTWN